MNEFWNIRGRNWDWFWFTRIALNYWRRVFKVQGWGRCGGGGGIVGICGYCKCNWRGTCVVEMPRRQWLVGLGSIGRGLGRTLCGVKGSWQRMRCKMRLLRMGIMMGNWKSSYGWSPEIWIVWIWNRDWEFSRTHWRAPDNNVILVTLLHSSGYHRIKVGVVVVWVIWIGCMITWGWDLVTIWIGRCWGGRLGSTWVGDHLGIHSYTFILLLSVNLSLL